MELYGRYKERWLQIKLSYKEIYTRYRKKDRIIEPREPFFMSEENNMDPNPILEYLPTLTQIKAMIIARAHIYI